ncbi:MAG: hypothetical protein DLM54_05090 [Acidimicrobiales bacterium]|nr:MAG: hypothetical protein DLM54_05090 [Acidimicrobiales bacterium]
MTRPAAVGLWVLAGLSIALASSDPLPRVVVLVGAWLLLVRSRLSGRRLAPLAIGVGALGGLSMLTNGLLSHTGATVLVSLPAWLPLVGGPVTLEGLVEGAAIGVGLAAAVSVAASLTLVIDSGDLVDALPWFLARLGAALGSALNLVPAVAGSFTSVREAQRMRGWRPRGLRSMVDLVVPVMVGAIERSVQLAESMEARAFGSGPRTRAGTSLRTWRGTILGIGSLAVLGVFAAVRVSGLGGAGWYPYPTLSTPSWGIATLGPPFALAVLSVVAGHQR